MQTHEIITAFMQAMLEHDIQPPDRIQADGVLHRFHIAGHKSGSLNGAYKLHLDGAKPAGYFEDFKAGTKATWKADAPTQPMTNEERRRQAERKRQTEADRAAKHQRAAEMARRLWNQSKPIKATEEHPYLIRKQISPHGLRLLPAWQKRIKDDTGQWQSLAVKSVLVVPLVDIKNRLWNLQAIFPENMPALGDRDKDFLGGGKLSGLFACIGQATPERIICEGWATGATLHEATGYQTFCAMSAGNLRTVAALIRNHRPDTKLIICADNDKTPGNPGVRYATEAARAVGGLLCVSPVGDFNDFATAGKVAL